MHNVVYVCGSHGSGKSTLIKKLAEKDPELFVMYKKLGIPKFEDPLERQKIRAVKYYWDAVNQEKISKNNPEKVLLCDRCILSSYVYVESLFQRGWLTKEEHDSCIDLCEKLFDDSIKPKNIILLNPSLDELKYNVRKRWAETGKKKWREEDFGYLELTKKNFEKPYANYGANLLKIDFLDLEKRVLTCYDWIAKIAKGDSL